MKQLSRTISTLLFIIAILFANTYTVFASGEDGEHVMEREVNGYHVTLSSQNEWAKGENTLLVTITDSMGMAVSDADVEIVLAPKSDEHAESDGHGEPASDSHAEVESDSHGSETPNDSMPGMDMGGHESETTEAAAHEEEITAPLVMTETHEHGVYTAQAHLEASGEQEIQVLFHVNGEMLQADFTVDVTGTSSKTIVLWSFLLINVGIVISAGILKSQPVAVKVK
jgi:hypothetical protein